MAIAFLVGRIVTGLYFLMSGFNHFSNVQMMSGYAASKGIPAPRLAVLGSGVLLLIGSLSFLTGILPLVGAAALILVLVPVTFSMHAFWKEESQETRMAEMVNFTKNMGLVGLILMTVYLPQPWPFSINLF